jgi:hypothetical protein
LLSSFTKYAEFVRVFDLAIAICVALPPKETVRLSTASDVDLFDSWCLLNGFEFIDLERDEAQDEGLKRGK